MLRTRQSWVLVVLALVLTTLSACGSTTQTEQHPLDVTFEEAALESRVPKHLLVGIGYTQTRLWMRAGQPGVGMGYGLMQLTDGPEGTLERAARLTGLTTEQLKTDVRANIRGAAAILRDEANRYFGEYAGKQEHELAHWWQIVMRYPGYIDAAAAEEFAGEVYRSVQKGITADLEDGSVYELPSVFVDTSNEQIFASSQHALSADYPGAEVRAANTNNYTAGRGGNRISMVIIHTAQGSWSSVWNWFTNPSAKASAHYVVRSSDGKIAQMVADADTAWHAGNWGYNQKSVAIEHEGYVDQPSWLTIAMLQSSANLTRWLCDTYGIPKDRAHIIGHNEVPNPNSPGKFGGVGGHSDPCVNIAGTTCYWNWSAYMTLVNPQSTPQNGSVQGYVFSSEGGSSPTGNTKPIAGATVTIVENGSTQTTDSKGFFKFSVPAGQYTMTAAASDFATGTPYLGNPRTVTAGATTFSSFVLNKHQATGTVQVLVYELNSANTSDKSTPVDGAIVSIDGDAVSTGSSGRATLVVAAGTHVVEIAKQGFDSSLVNVTVPAGGTVPVDVALKPTGVEASGLVYVRVYEVNPNNAADRSKALSGATVSIEGRSATTGGDGAAQLQAQAGARQVQVSKSGYVTASPQVNVVAGNTVTTEVGLNPTSNAPPTITITTPAEGAAFLTTPVEVKGQATGKQITVKVNGVSASVSLDGTYSASVPLSNGEGEIVAVARDSFGREAKAIRRVSYNADATGLQGKVVDVVTGEPIAGAILTTDGSMAVTTSDGSYVLTLGPGSHTVTLEAANYLARQVIVELAANAKDTHHFDMMPVGGDDAFTITSPKPGATVAAGDIEVTGKITLMRLGVLKVNGVEIPASHGAYVAKVNVPAGQTKRIDVVAKSIDGIELTRSVTVTGKAAKNAGCTSSGEATVLALLALGVLSRRVRRAV